MPCSGCAACVVPGARVAAGALAYAAMAAVAGGVLYLGTQGAFFQQRLATVSADADTRMKHWHTALGMMDRTLPTQVFGMGLGRFPETYLWRNPQGARPGNFRYAQDNGNGYLLLGAGETLYLAQRVSVQPHTRYRLAFDLRGDGQRLSLTVPLCEKHLLDSRRCNWKTYEVRGGEGWQHIEATLDSGRIGEGNWLSRPPVELFLYNGENQQRLAVDNLSLRAPDGRELLRNGDFSAAGDFWFFKTHDHLAWHIKNVWVSLLFEQGWLGLIAFNLLMLAALIHLGRPAWSGNPVPAAALTATVGFLTVGLFASPFDAPRLTALFFAVLAVGLHATPPPAAASQTQPSVAAVAREHVTAVRRRREGPVGRPQRKRRTRGPPLCACPCVRETGRPANVERTFSDCAPPLAETAAWPDTRASNRARPATAARAGGYRAPGRCSRSKQSYGRSPSGWRTCCLYRNRFRAGEGDGAARRRRG